MESKKILEERQKQIIDISRIPNGLYYLRIDDREDRLLKVKKLVIRR